MAYKTGQLAPIPVRRGDHLAGSIAFFANKEQTVPIELDVYEDICMDIRSTPHSRGDLLARALLGDGLTVTGHVLEYDFGAFDHPAKKYYTDIRFQLPDKPPLTLLVGTVECIENITEMREGG